MKKKICFITDSIFSYGGVQRVTAVIAKELAKDYDVTILTFDKKESHNPELYNLNESSIKYKFFTYPILHSIIKKAYRIISGIYLKLQPRSEFFSNIYARSSFPYKLRKALLDMINQERYDIVIGVHAPLAARLATIKKKLPPTTKCVGWLHNSFYALFGESSLYIGVRRKRHYIYQFKKLDQVIALCRDDVNKYSQYDNSFKPIVIYNPLTLTPKAPSTGMTKRFLTVGRFTPLHKGIDLLIEAFAIFSNKNEEWVLDIVGEGVEENSYRSLIMQKHLENRIHIHPFTNNIQDYYSNAQIYVLSSRWEGMPLVLVEAMSHGLPIVTSDLPVCKEILGDFGMYFKNGDIHDLAYKLEESTKINWHNKSEEALNIAKKYNIEHIITQWKNLIEE